MAMKVWLDGMRTPPDGWQHVRCPEDAIILLFKAVEKIKRIEKSRMEGIYGQAAT